MLLNKKSFYFGIPFLLGFLIALTAPLNILDYRLANLIYELVSVVIPSVRKMKGDYQLGYVAKFYYSCLWLLSPLIFRGAYVGMRENSENMFKKWRRNKLFLLFAMGIFFPLCIFAAINFTFENNNSDDIRNYLSFHSRWGLPFWGFIVPAGAAALAAMVVFWAKNFFRMFD